MYIFLLKFYPLETSSCLTSTRKILVGLQRGENRGGKRVWRGSVVKTKGPERFNLIETLKSESFTFFSKNRCHFLFEQISLVSMSFLCKHSLCFCRVRCVLLLFKSISICNALYEKTLYSKKLST